MPQTTAIDGGALLFSFDDTFIAEWVAALPIFAQTEARCTFFVSHPDRVLASQLAGLQQLQAAGHVIGCHSLRHEKAVDAVAAGGLDSWLERDVLPALALLRDAGCPATSFAYPCSQNDVITDAALLQHFRHLRTGRGLDPGMELVDLDALFTPAAQVAARGCLVGTSLDYSGLERRPHRPRQVPAGAPRRVRPQHQRRRPRPSHPAGRPARYPRPRPRHRPPRDHLRRPPLTDTAAP